MEETTERPARLAGLARGALTCLDTGRWTCLSHRTVTVPPSPTIAKLKCVPSHRVGPIIRGIAPYRSWLSEI